MSLVTTVLSLALFVCLCLGCESEGRNITNSFGYYEKSTGASMRTAIEAAEQAMAEMDMTITKKDVDPMVTKIRGHTDDDKRVDMSLTWLNVEYIRIGLRIGDGMVDGGDPRAVALIERMVAILHPRAVPRDSIDYPESMPERLRF